MPNENVTLLSASSPPRVQKAFADLAARVKADEAVVVLLIGHGSFDGTKGAFNLPGPDPTVAEWSALLGKLPSQRVAFINTSSSSGAFLPAILAPGRVVVTATKTGGERNETLFPEYFVAAFGDPAADSDRNGHVSIAEAFEYAKAKVVDAFKQKGNLLTEHAVMDDGGEGRLAATIIWASAAATPPWTRAIPMKALVDEWIAIERQVEALKPKSRRWIRRSDAQMETP